MGGDMKGDGYQNGGTLIVDKGGKLLLQYIQENPADHVPLPDVLKALNITSSRAQASPDTQGASGAQASPPQSNS